MDQVFICKFLRWIVYLRLNSASVIYEYDNLNTARAYTSYESKIISFKSCQPQQMYIYDNKYKKCKMQNAASAYTEK